MRASDYLMLLAFAVVLLATSYPLGLAIAAISQKTRGFDTRALGWIGIDAEQPMGWKHYAGGLLLFNVLGIAAVFALQMLQASLPLNPQNLGNISWHSALNTAVSFVTNTNWQGYAGESTLSAFTQMTGLSVQNFLSAATGIAVALALIRGFANKSSQTIGNVWADLSRVTLYVLLPLSLVFALFLGSQGVAQSLAANQEVKLMQPHTSQQSSTAADGKVTTTDVIISTQTLPMGPVASQEAIKMIGTNGGGYYNANSAHPFENPTPLTNFLQMLAIFLIPAALCFTLGKLVGDMRQGWVLLGAMSLLFTGMLALILSAELQTNPAWANLQQTTAGAANMEGKEARFGVVASALFAAITTAASCGAVNAMHDSFMPMAGFALMLQMQLGEVVFGGVGSGLYGTLIFAVLAVFIAGNMIGRTPEYLGKKIEPFEMKMVALAVLVTPFLVLSGTAISVLVDAGKVGISNPAAHGFSQILYAFSSAANNNGSAFAGLSANTPYYNLMLAVAMFVGRFGVILPVLAVAGALAAKKRMATGPGTMPTHGPLFLVLLATTVLIVGALTYIPALALGPVIEHLQLFAPALSTPTPR